MMQKQKKRYSTKYISKQYPITRYTKKKKQSKVNRLYLSKNKYFINKCVYNVLDSFDYSILENYLQKLGYKPDKIIDQFTSIYHKQAKQNRITFQEFCNFEYRIKPKIDTKIIKNIKANIIFYDISRPYLNINLYNINSLLINMLNINFYNITNKHVIYKNIKQVAPELYDKYFIKIFNINNLKEYHFPSWYILRPNDSFGGADIKYINNLTDLHDAIIHYNGTKNYKGVLYGNNVIASPYITDLLLFRNRKFHLRMYFIVSCIYGILSSFLLKEGKILTALEPFDMNDPFTKAKHDTHLKSTGADYFISSDFTTDNLGLEITDSIYNKFYNKCKKLCSGITKSILYNIFGTFDINNITNTSKILYENQKNGYHLFGLDIFVTKDFNPILIECNEQPGIGTFSKQGNIKINKIIYKWINSIILEPLLKYNDPFIAQKHKTYITL
jgi:hypothetical protein